MPENAEPALSNAAIAGRLLNLAQLLATQNGNAFKVKAYRRAARTIKTLSESIADLVRDDADLTRYPGIGKGISGAIREIVLSGSLRQIDTLRSQVGAEVAEIGDYPRLDPKRVLRIYKKLKISSINELQEKLAGGEIAEKLGARMDQHVRQALTESHQMLIHDARKLADAVQEFLVTKCPVRRAEPTGDYRRRTELIQELSFLIETDDFPAVISKLKRYGGKAEVLRSDADSALFQLASEHVLRIDSANKEKWGLAQLIFTGSNAHLAKLAAAGKNLHALAGSDDSYPEEADIYRSFGLRFIEPELREGNNEIELAARGPMPVLVSVADIRGELHAHSTSSDGRNSIEQMVEGARKKGYQYTGITDHSQSLKIAGGVSEADLRQQIRYIDKLNGKLRGFRILKSAEVDILADGSLDYPDHLLKELDYTVCSIHSKFTLGKKEQTDRIRRAMDNRYFTILGHATGRMLLKRPGYEIDLERVVECAKQNGCFFEINSSPDRLDLSAVNARIANEAGVKIAINTDAHSIREFDYIAGGVDQARRAGLEKSSVLNCHSCDELLRMVER